MNRYHLIHFTEFRYDAAVSESYNEVRLRPIHDERQSCLSFRLNITPSTRSLAYHDAFGNWVHQFNVPVQHRYLKVEAESVVLAHESTGQASSGSTLSALDEQREDLYEEQFDFLAATEYVPHLPQLEELSLAAEAAADGTVAGFAQAASDLIHQRFQYIKGATHVHSSILDSLSMQAGVCQDFAHVLLGVLRRRGVPARYVSGYVVPRRTVDGTAVGMEEVIGGQASHAWVEALVAPSVWMPLDPTLGAPVGLRHVRLAYGRDYGDVAPVRGVYKGHAGQRLSVDVRVRPALDSEGREQLAESAAAPLEAEVSERPQQPAQQQQQQ